MRIDVGRLSIPWQNKTNRSDMHKSLTLLALLLTCLCNSSWTQDSLALGNWDIHLAKRVSQWVTQSDEHIYISTGQHVMAFGMDDLNPTEVSRVDGLSETSIDKLIFDKRHDQLVIIYKSGGIDVLKDDEVSTITAIKDNKNIIGQKRVNDLHIEGQYLYLATSFGLVQFDLSTLDFGFTLFIDGGASSITSDGTDLYLGLGDGLYTITLDDLNPQDITRWTKEGEASGLPSSYDISQVEYANQKIYAVIDDELFVKENDQYTYLEIDVPNEYVIRFMSADMGRLLVGLRGPVSTSEARLIDVDGTITVSPRTCVNRILYGIEDPKGRFWYADEWRGIRYTSSFNFGCNRLQFNSPLTNECTQVVVDQKTDRVLWASGGATDNYGPLNKKEGVYILEGKKDWKLVNQDFFPEIKENKFENFLSIAPHPDGAGFAAASYSAGLMTYRYEDQELKFYDDNNSAIQTTTGDVRQRIAFVKYDENGNLWCSNFAAEKPLVVFTPEGNSFSFSVPGSKNLAKIEIDDRGYIWVLVIGNSGGVLVFDHNGTVNDPTDDRTRFFSTGNSELQTFIVNTVQKDRSGDVWIGTAEGPVVFDCDPFDSGCRGARRKVEQDGQGDYLLRFEDVLSIGVDGADRKWFGTRNGIFVQSSSGENLVEKFTVENSPLLDNTVLDMDFDPQSGRMYVSTAQGMQSYRTFTSGSRKSHSNDVYAYPNPIRPDYTGDIAIKGLGQDANVKITDINGVLVYETTALGGQAIWNGQDYNGRRAAPGVYLVFSTSELSFDEVDTYVAKLLFVE